MGIVLVLSEAVLVVVLENSIEDEDDDEDESEITRNSLFGRVLCNGLSDKLRPRAPCTRAFGTVQGKWPGSYKNESCVLLR